MSTKRLSMRPPPAMTDIDFHQCKLSPQLAFVMLSWSTSVMLSFLELTEEDCFRHVYVYHPCDVASPAQLHLKQDGLCWSGLLSAGLLHLTRSLAI